MKFLTVDDFWVSGALEARIHSFYYTKMLQKIQENLWEHPGKILFLQIWTSKNRKNEGMCTSFFLLRISFLNYILRS